MYVSGCVWGETWDHIPRLKMIFALTPNGSGKYRSQAGYAIPCSPSRIKDVDAILKSFVGVARIALVFLESFFLSSFCFKTFLGIFLRS